MITHLVDSDWLIDLLRERSNAVQLLRPLMEQGNMAISLIAYAEVYEGVLGDPRREERLTDLARLLAGVPVIAPDEETAEVFARLRSELRPRGELLADHDLWIAATALRHNLVLVARDHHFDRIESLRRS